MPVLFQERMATQSWEEPTLRSQEDVSKRKTNSSSLIRDSKALGKYLFITLVAYFIQIVDLCQTRKVSIKLDHHTSEVTARKLF